MHFRIHVERWICDTTLFLAHISRLIIFHAVDSIVMNISIVTISHSTRLLKLLRSLWLRSLWLLDISRLFTTFIPLLTWSEIFALSLSVLINLLLNEPILLAIRVSVWALTVNIHLVSHLLLYGFEGLAVHELRERVQLLLMKQGHKVVAKPSHLAFSVIQWILQNSASIAICVSLWLLGFSQSLLLDSSFGISSLSDAFFKEHDNESANLIIWRFFWTLSE